MRSIAFGALLLASSASADAVKLTGKNFEKQVFGKKGKSAFVKFLAPVRASRARRVPVSPALCAVHPPDEEEMRKHFHLWSYVRKLQP